MQRIKLIEGDLVGDQASNKKARETIREILRIRSEAIDAVRGADTKISEKLEGLKEWKGEAVFVSKFDITVVVHITNNSDGINIRFEPNLDNLPPGIIGISDV